MQSVSAIRVDQRIRSMDTERRKKSYPVFPINKKSGFPLADLVFVISTKCR